MMSNNLCANCGKADDDDDDIKLKTCVACKMIQYCGKECQVSHWPAHKKECKQRAAEIYDEKLFADPPPREECPICFITLPRMGVMWHNCCGKNICDGCMLQSQDMGNSDKCAFCRADSGTTEIQDLVRLEKRMRVNNDPEAFNTMGCHYEFGFLNLIPQDYTKARENWSKAASLGSILAHRNIGYLYYEGTGVEKNLKKAIYHFEQAAMGGHEVCRHILGVEEEKRGNLRTRAIKHYFLAAKGGYEDALIQVHRGYINGYATKDEFESARRAYQKSIEEVKTEWRDKAEVVRAQEKVYYASMNTFASRTG